MRYSKLMVVPALAGLLTLGACAGEEEGLENDVGVAEEQVAEPIGAEEGAYEGVGLEEGTLEGETEELGTDLEQGAEEIGEGVEGAEAEVEQEVGY